MTGWLRLFGIGLVFALAVPPAGYGAMPGKALGRKTTIGSATANGQAETRLSVLVVLEPGRDRAPVRELARSRGGRVKYEYAILPTVMNVRNLPESAVEAIERLDGVERVETDDVIRLHLNQSTPLIHALESDVAGAGFAADGSGVRVCIVDTGIAASHVMYADRIDAASGRDFVNNDGNPEDDNGHGSHVAGIAGGGDGNSINFGCAGDEPFQGVAWEATLVGVKVVDALGFGTESDLIAGIDHCANQTTSGGRADVINLSLGAGSFVGTCDGDVIAQAANAAVDAGVVVVASSGNSGEPNALASPACGSKVIAVGATYDDPYPDCEWPFPECWEWCLQSDGLCGCLESCSDCFPAEGQVACFSNQSALLDAVAPGCVTASANYQEPGGAEYMCGTSMAAPHVTGVAALVLSRKPSLTPAQVRQALRDGAVDLGVPGPDGAYGYGMVDALGSLSVVACGSDLDCDDGDACTTETCNVGTGDCVTTGPECGATDDCCVSGCASDPDCCLSAGASCSSGAQCCSGSCRGKAGNKTCR
jgi:serine protease AprX